jgi:membrane protein HdeD
MSFVGKLLVKLLLNGILAVPLLMWFCEAGFVEAALISIVLSAIAYVAGDRMILPLTNNTIATISDFLLAFIVLWTVGSVMDWTLSFGEIAIISLAVAAVEVWYHHYLQNDRRKQRA